MKTKLSFVLLAALLFLTLYSFSSYKSTSNQEPTTYKWSQITVIESVVAAGFGRSRMISTDSNGKMNEEKLKNLFSATGINMGNIKENDLKITNKISKMSNEGWELHDVSTGVSMYGQENSEGIYMTRYLFRKAV